MSIPNRIIYCYDSRLSTIGKSFKLGTFRHLAFIENIKKYVHIQLNLVTITF